MLADLKSGRLRCDRFELAADVGRRVRLGIETVVLRQTTRKENEDERFNKTKM